MKTLLKKDVEEIINKINDSVPKNGTDVHYIIKVEYKNGHSEVFNDNQSLYDYLLLKKVSNIQISMYGLLTEVFKADTYTSEGLRSFEKNIYKI